MCVYFYIHIYIHRTRTYIVQTKTFILDAINRLTALIIFNYSLIYTFICTIYVHIIYLHSVTIVFNVLLQ